MKHQPCLKKSASLQVSLSEKEKYSASVVENVTHFWVSENQFTAASSHTCIITPRETDPLWVALLTYSVSAKTSSSTPFPSWKVIPKLLVSFKYSKILKCCHLGHIFQRMGVPHYCFRSIQTIRPSLICKQHQATYQLKERSITFRLVDIIFFKLHTRRHSSKSAACGGELYQTFLQLSLVKAFWDIVSEPFSQCFEKWQPAY